MKHMKMLGLAAIAALGLMAFAGAGTASAITLATDAAGITHYTVGTEFHWTLKKGTSATLKDTSGNTIATCTGSTILETLAGPVVETNKVKFASGSVIVSVVTKIVWEGCSQTTDTLALGKLELSQVGSEDKGTVVSKESKVTLGIFGVSCVYGTSEGTTLGTVAGGSEPELAVNATLPKIEGGFLCPSTGIWNANYVLTSPHAVHIVK